jgi:hypothetical protein
MSVGRSFGGWSSRTSLSDGGGFSTPATGQRPPIKEGNPSNQILKENEDLKRTDQSVSICTDHEIEMNALGPNENVTVTLTESPTIWLLDMMGNSSERDCAEGAAIAERNQEYKQVYLLNGFIIYL